MKARTYWAISAILCLGCAAFGWKVMCAAFAVNAAIWQTVANGRRRS